MNRETSSHLVDEYTYTFLLNGNNETTSGEKVNLTNEPSNLLSVRFPSGFKNIGYRNDINSDKIFFILTNPDTKLSSIGYASSIQNIQSTADIEDNCTDCDYSRLLSEPLEDQDQEVSHFYTELINDSCNGDLNLDINFPIKNLEIKVEKFGTTLYWAENRNPSRYFNTDNVDYYKYKGEVVCGIDNTVPVCIDVSKLLMEPNHTVIHLDPETLQIGGNLKQGTYIFTAAYCDENGNETTQYCTPTNPVPIFDENNSIILQQELNQLTNFAIKVKVNNLDLRFKYYKVIVIERSNLLNAESYYEEGIHSTTDDTILYTTSATIGQNNIVSDIVSPIKRTTLENIVSVRQRFEKVEGVVAVNKHLFQHGLTAKKEDNLQPVFNMIGAFLKWRSSIAKETLYKSPIASSKYKGYMRDEVQPFAARLIYNDGDYSSNFQLVARPATTFDKAQVSSADLNLISVNNNSPEYTSSDRNKNWQVFNTATNEGLISCNEAVDDTSETVIKPTVKTSLIEGVAFISGNVYTISVEDSFTNLTEYLNDNLSEILTATSGDKYYPDIKAALLEVYTTDHLVPNFTNCDIPVLLSETNSIANVFGACSNIECLEYESNLDILDYTKSIPPTSCDPYLRNTDGTYSIDLDLQSDYMDCNKVAYFRQELLNVDCRYAIEVADNNTVSTAGQGFYNNSYKGDALADLITTKNSVLIVPDSDFQNKLHKGALWLKINTNNREKLIFEITKNSNYAGDETVEVSKKLRYTFYENCNSIEPIIEPKVISTLDGIVTIQDLSLFPKNSFYVAIDVPITSVAACSDSIVRFRTAPPKGCFSVFTRDLKIKSLKVTTTSISINKTEKYEAQCSYVLPKLSDYNPVPYEQGKFAYWESLETYPDNAELYNSSDLKIRFSDLNNLTIEQRLDFESYFKESVSNGVYNLKSSTNLQCEPIRHHKFPDNNFSPFLGTDEIVEFAESTIFPLGVHLDNNIVNTFLDIAVHNNLISKSKRDTIVGFEIFKADNSINKSVITNALGYDMYKYNEEGDDVYYSNYPHNDLGKDMLHAEDGVIIDHPNGGNYNSKFSLISPEFTYSKPSIPTEIVLSGYQIGNSRGYFSDVEDHSKWVILSDNGRTLASVLGIVEAALESVIKTAELLSNSWFIVGLANGFSLGTVGTIVATAGYVASAALRKGKYTSQWEIIFRDLGSPENFASFYTSEGYHNRLIKNESKPNYLRTLSIKKYMREGRFLFTDEETGSKIKVNNFSRENSTFISLGDEKNNNGAVDLSKIFTYSDEYKNNDNNNKSLSTSSRTISSSNNCSKKEIQRNVGSPYFTLKNYLPAQFGNVDTLKWISTNYTSNLKEDNSCEIIFGGTVFISRFTYKRKIQLFKNTAFGLPDKLPFNYSNYQNIAEAVYYCDYETGGESKLFPTIKSDYKLDCLNRRQFYIKSPSKFYLYYYGIANYLVESEINCNNRYGKVEPADQFYPQCGDLIDWTQEKNVPISKPNTFFYNSVYSLPVYSTPYKTLNRNYARETWDKASDSPNGVIYSLQDNTENSLSDPWLIYKPLNRHEFSTKYGKLVGLKNLESESILGRFENQQVLFNKVDNLANESSPRMVETGNAGIFANRAIEFSTTDLGYGGTQNSEIVSTPYGHFSVDAKRGKVFQLDQTGRQLQPISDITGQKESGLKSWFRQQLPFKLLRQFPEVDIDNKFKGIGISMGWDARLDRLFITKKDYIAINTECLKYSREEGFYTDCGSENIICAEGYTYNTDTNLCELVGPTLTLCPPGYTYDQVNQRCVTTEVTSSISKIVPDVTADSEIICSGTNTSIPLSSTQVGTTYTWTVVQSGVSGAIGGSGSNIAQTLVNSSFSQGTATYTVTPTLDECEGPSIDIVVTVKPIPNVIATPSSQSINDGDQMTIALSSNVEGATFTWTVAESGTSGATAGSGSTITQTLTGTGSTTYTIIPTANGCEGAPVNSTVTVESGGIPCGGSINASGQTGYYEVNTLIGTDTGDVTVTFNALTVPDRLQIIWDGNIVADSLFVGDGLPNTNNENEVLNASTLQKYLYDGSQFQPNGTIAVDYNSTDIASYSINRPTSGNGSVGNQIGVVGGYPTGTPKASDGDIKIKFNKTTAQPTNITIVVVGVSESTAWIISNLECPTV